MDHTPLPPLPEEGDSYTSENDAVNHDPADPWTSRHHPPRPDHGPGPAQTALWTRGDHQDRGGGLLAATVEEAVRRALGGTVNGDPGQGTAPGPATVPPATQAQGPVRKSDTASGTNSHGRSEQRDQNSRRWATNATRRELTSLPRDQPHARDPGDDGSEGDYEYSGDVELSGGDGDDRDGGETTDRLEGGRGRSDSRVKPKEGEGASGGTQRGRSDRSQRRRKETRKVRL